MDPRTEAIRSRGFIRGAETQLTKAIDAIDAASDLSPVNLEYAKDIAISNRRIWADPAKVRRGEVAGDKHDGLRIWRSERITAENISACGAVDEVVSVVESRDVTLRKLVISEPSRSLHPKGVPHDYALLIVGVDEPWGDAPPITVDTALILDCGARNPTLLASHAYGGITSGELHVRLSNIVVWQPHRFGLKVSSTDPKHHVGTIKADITSCLYLLTERSDIDQFKRTLQHGDWQDVYMRDCWVQTPDGVRHDLIQWANITPGRDTPNFEPLDSISDPDELYRAVIEQCGAFPRDVHDLRMIEQMEASQWQLTR